MMWNIVTFVALLLILAAFTYAFIWLLTLPGKLAVKRQHPHAEAVKLMGNLGFLGAALSMNCGSPKWTWNPADAFPQCDDAIMHTSLFLYSFLLFIWL